MTRPEKLLAVFREILEAGSEYMGISKQILADAFAKKFHGEPTATNRELVDAFLAASDRGWIEVIDVPGKG